MRVLNNMTNVFLVKRDATMARIKKIRITRIIHSLLFIIVISSYEMVKWKMIIRKI